MGKLMNLRYMKFLLGMKVPEKTKENELSRDFVKNETEGNSLCPDMKFDEKNKTQDTKISTKTPELSFFQSDSSQRTKLGLKDSDVSDYMMLNSKLNILEDINKSNLKKGVKNLLSKLVSKKTTSNR